MKVIVTDKMADDGIIYLREKGFEVDVKFGIARNELLDIIGEYDAIIVRSTTKVDEELLEKATNLKVAARAGNGIDNIDVKACTKRGIAVVNTPEGNIMAAAELTIGLIFALFRNIPQAYHAGKNKDFRRNKFSGIELDGKTAGVIGLGRIGTIVATKLRGLNMKVVAYDPYLTEERAAKLRVEKCETIEELLAQSDVVTVHVPKTPETYNLIGEKELKMCKKGARIINVARGGIINEQALYNALKEGHIAGAALDVIEKEPAFNKKPEEQDFSNPLIELDNVIYTPHLGASTEEASHNVSLDSAKLVEGVLNGQIVSAVNMPHISNGDINGLRPYILLAEMLGKIYYQSERETVERIEVIYRGDLVDKETKLISLSALKGLLDPVVSENINYVNVEFIANGMGVSLVESKSSCLEKYTNLITVKFCTKSRELSVSGTVFAKEEIRIVDFFGYKLDFEPSPTVIAIQNIDKPGMIGKIGSILGAGNVNIAAMQWSRNRKGEKAVAFISVDGDVTEEMLKQLREIDGVLRVSKLRF
ncbi:MAG TPA: phosphoglycerate dehydrogenase [Clostridiaceae bacterium]|nr:phosphoglycerate dehydrogenase [Clostridiaceae bacterium]